VSILNLKILIKFSNLELLVCYAQLVYISDYEPN